MANRKVSVWKYVKAGSRWKYCKPVYGRNNKIKRDWVLVKGNPEQHPEGNFYICYSELYEQKCGTVFQHIFDSYQGQGKSLFVN